MRLGSLATVDAVQAGNLDPCNHHGAGLLSGGGTGTIGAAPPDHVELARIDRDERAGRIDLLFRLYGHRLHDP